MVAAATATATASTSGSCTCNTCLEARYSTCRPFCRHGIDRTLCMQCHGDPDENNSLDYFPASRCVGCGDNGGHVQHCGHCNTRYCPSCLPFNCKIHKHSYHWDRMPGGLKDLVSEMARQDINAERLRGYLIKCMGLWPSDKDFDIVHYRRLCESWASAYVLAGIYFAEQKPTGTERMGCSCHEAVYMLFYAVLLEDLRDRGPNRTLELFQQMRESPELFITHFESIRFAVKKTSTRLESIWVLQRVTPTLVTDCRIPLESILHSISRDGRQNCKIHDLPAHGDKLVQKFGKDKGTISSSRLEVVINNVDSANRKKETPYDDTSLSWLLKLYRLRHLYHPDLLCPEITTDTKFFRVIHNGRTLFHSTWGKKTLLELGVKVRDEITVGGVEQREEDPGVLATNTKVLKNSKNKKNKGPNRCNNKNNKKSTVAAANMQLSEEQLEEKYREEHSRAMTPVFEQMGPMLKDIRNELNAMGLQKSKPKVRGTKRDTKKGEVDPASLLLPAEDGLGRKAGKSAYPVLVGEVANLYKTTKFLSRSPIVIDLHGDTVEEATNRLDESLPVWIDDAMKGEYPWVRPVDIICGGGNQILSETVQKWIRGNRHVANRPKGV